MIASTVIVVVGSVNMDLVVQVPRQPKPGETLLGSDYESHPGGKGANQAVAAARAGGRVRFVGRTGDDGFGERLRAALAAEDLELGYSRVLSGASGLALISVAPGGQNSIIVAPGANARLQPADLEEEAFAGAKLLLLQLEIPLETTLEAARLGRGAGAKVMLNLAPAQRLEKGALRHVDLLLVNEPEAAALLELEGSDVARDPEAAAQSLGRLVPQAVLTLGARGAVWATAAETGYQPAFAVQAVDTTAAGDAFAGALAVALVEGAGLQEATRRASAAGALAASRPGAQPSLPRKDEIAALLGR